MNKQVKQIRNEVKRLIRWYNAPFTKRGGVSGEEILNNLLSFIDSLEEEPDCTYNHTTSEPKITVGTKIRPKTNHPDVILNIISNDCHEDKFECSNGSVLSLKQIEKYYDIII